MAACPLFLIVFNKHHRDPITAAVVVDGFPPRSMTAFEIQAELVRASSGRQTP